MLLPFYYQEVITLFLPKFEDGVPVGTSGIKWDDHQGVIGEWYGGSAREPHM